MKLNRSGLLILLLFLSVIFLYLYQFVFSSTRIAYVDSAKLLASYEAMKDARHEYEMKTKAWQANIDTLSFDVQQSIRDYEKTAATGSPKERELARKLIANKQKELTDYQRAIQQNAQQEEGKLNQDVVSQINSFLTGYGKKHNYKIILIAANGNIAYADRAMDITEEVIEQLNNNYAKSNSGK